MKSDLLLLAVLLLSCCFVPASAQQIQVSDFCRLKRPLWKRKLVPVDKQLATVDFLTAEKDFQFLANGKTEIQAEEGEGTLTLRMPDRTAFVRIDHAEYGTLIWKPEGGQLRKKRRYQARLWVWDPTKEYKPRQQWVVFKVSPPEALIEIDSLVRTVRTGETQLQLPLGKHPYRIEAPFHEAAEGEVELTDSARAVKVIRLQPFYSYLAVYTDLPTADIFIDDAWAGQGQATSRRLTAGLHRVTVAEGLTCRYDSLIRLHPADKQVIRLRGQELQPRQWHRQPSAALAAGLSATSANGTGTEQGYAARKRKRKQTADSSPADGLTVTAPQPRDTTTVAVSITAPDERTEIWIDRERYGTGKWEGRLGVGFHTVHSCQDSIESAPNMIWLEADMPVELTLPTPHAALGALNVHSNVAGAEIEIDGIPQGVTPSILLRLPAHRPLQVTLHKAGYKPYKTQVILRPNEATDLSVKLKKK